MKVLQIIQKRQLRGAEIFACQLADELKKLNCHVDVLYLFEGTNDLEFEQVQFISLGANRRLRFFDVLSYRKLSKIIKEGGYDIVQANAGDTLKYAVFSKYLFRWRAKLVFRNANLMSAFAKSRMKKSFNSWLLGNCDDIISVSDNCRKDMLKLRKEAEIFSVTIPIGSYDFHRIAPAGIDFVGPIIMCVGSLVPEKNHMFLIDVFEKYCQTDKPGVLLIVGDGKLRTELTIRVTRSAFNARICLLGYRTDVISLIKASDMLLIPSLIEGLPGVILEAMSCEVPVIASSVGGIPELIANDISGICLDGWIIDEYVSSISKVLNDKEYRKKLVHQAKEMFKANYTMDKVSLRFLNRYKSLVITNLI